MFSDIVFILVVVVTSPDEKPGIPQLPPQPPGKNPIMILNEIRPGTQYVALTDVESYWRGSRVFQMEVRVFYTPNLHACDGQQNFLNFMLIFIAMGYYFSHYKRFN